MALWFDVTDLRWWSHSHLTGIQRTAVSVLSELARLRGDVRLFAYDRSANRLVEVDVRALPPVARSSLAVPAGGSDRGNAIASPRRLALVNRLRLVSPRLRLFVSPVLRRTIGQEGATALKNFLKSGRNLVQILGRRIRPGRPAARTRSRVLSPQEVLFRPGDVCLTLSASWLLPDYGEVMAQNLRLGGAKAINMLYDLIPALFPEWTTPHESEHFARWARRQIENADVLLTISRFQKAEIAKYIKDERLPERPIEAIRLGDDPAFFGKHDGRSGGALPLPRYVPERKFVVCVSTIDVRKNHALLYHVWRRLAQDLGPACPQLLLIGTTHMHATDVLHQIRYDRTVNRLIVHLRDIVDEELAWYYRHCEFTTYPSVYEGWGLPVSESLALGKYCLASDRTSLPEAGGDLVDYFDPQDFYGCYRLFHRAITDPDYARKREKDVRENYRPYSWKMTAAHISGIVDGLVSTAPSQEASTAAS